MSTALLTAALLALAGQAQAPPPPPAQTAQPAPSFDTTRIREALAEPPSVRLDTGARFHVNIIGRRPLFDGLVPGADLKYGPVPRSGMTHRDFVSIVTPRELWQPSGAAAGETLMGGLVAAGAGKLLNVLLGKLEKAQNARELRRIREQIERELQAIEKRRGGGL